MVEQREPIRGVVFTGAEGRTKVRLLLADDHVVIRQGLARLLESHADVEIVGQAANGQEVIDLALQLQPDIVLMDIEMPGINGIRATHRILKVLPQTQILGLSMHEEPEMAAQMLDAGAVALLRKDIGASDLIAAVFRHYPATK
jgi:DNA-binding NarL/FixJ family response regulator